MNEQNPGYPVSRDGSFASLTTKPAIVVNGVSPRLLTRFKNLAITGASVSDMVSILGIPELKIRAALELVVEPEDAKFFNASTEALAADIASNGVLTFNDLNAAARSKRAVSAVNQADKIHELKNSVLTQAEMMIQNGGVRTLAEAMNAFKILDGAKSVPTYTPGGTADATSVGSIQDPRKAAGGQPIQVNYTGVVINGRNREQAAVLDGNNAVVGLRTGDGSEVVELGNVSSEHIDALADASDTKSGSHSPANGVGAANSDDASVLLSLASDIESIMTASDAATQAAVAQEKQQRMEHAKSAFHGIDNLPEDFGHGT